MLKLLNVSLLATLCLAGCASQMRAPLNQPQARVETPTRSFVITATQPRLLDARLLETQVKAPGRSFVIQPQLPQATAQVPPATAQKPVLAVFDLTRWVLRRLQGDMPVVVAAPGQEPRLKMNSGRVDGYTGCNLFNGSYRRQEDRILFLKVAGAVEKCATAPLQQQQQAYIAVLQQARYWHIDDATQHLLLLGAQRQPLAEFEAVYPQP